MERFMKMLSLSLESYAKNIKIISFCAIPFLVSFPVALMLPNYAALGAIFLRMDSIRWDLALPDILVTLGLPLVSMLLFSFALVAINMAITKQRTLTRVTFYEFEKIEHKTFELFEICFLAFAATIFVNLYLYGYGLHATIGALASALAAVAMLFVPQAIVIDGLGGANAVKKSIRTLGRTLPHTIMFLMFSAFLIALNDAVFIQLSASPAVFLFARYATVAINALVILPVLEVLKVQIYLEKYTLL
jgi:hypothetical protein